MALRDDVNALLRQECPVLSLNASLIASLATSPDGTLLVSAGNDSLVTVRNVAVGSSHMLSKHVAEVCALAFSPDKTLASGSLVGTIMLWDGRHEDTRRHADEARLDLVPGVESGRQDLASGNNKTIKL